MPLPQSLNAIFRASSSSIENEKKFQLFLAKLEDFDNFLKTKTDQHSKVWQKKFHGYVSDCYAFINGEDGYSEVCDQYVIDNQVIRIALDYMRWMDRAFAGADFATVIDRIFSPAGTADPSNYPDCCRELFKCYELLLNEKVEIFPIEIVEFLCSIKVAEECGCVQDEYLFQFGWEIGPIPYWFYTRMNFYINNCKNVGGLIRHFATAIGLNKSFRVTVDYKQSYKDRTLRVGKHLHLKAIHDYQKQCLENGDGIHRFWIETTNGRFLFIELLPFDSCLYDLKAEEIRTGVCPDVSEECLKAIQLLLESYYDIRRKE